MNENLSLMDKLVNNEGVKFTVTATLAPEVYAKIFLVIASSVILSGFALTLIHNAIKK